MGKYYYLIAGLPNITLEDSKLPFTIAEFRQELEGMLSASDRKLIDLFFLKFDNKNLLNHLLTPDREEERRGTITQEEYSTLLDALKEEEKPPKNNRIPPYMEEFFKLYLAAAEKEGGEKIRWEDRLSALYYAYAMKCKNAFVSAWFELNLNINNLLTAITARKYQLDKADYIVGDNEIAQILRSSNARDFGLGDSVEYLPELQRIAEESDLHLREKKIDQLKWNWLDENTFFKTFDIESVFAYMLQIEMIERWVTLDRAKGEQTFRQLIGTMKQGSDNALDEFKKNNKK